MADESPSADPDRHRPFAVEANNSVWDYLTKPERTDDDIDQMLERAYAAAHHWRLATEPGAIQRARAAWLLSRVHAVTGQADLAMRHARRCAELTEAAGDAAADFDRGYAAEALARALALAGDLDAAREARARAASIEIANDDDRSIFESDLADGPWFGLDQPAG